jgi:hypothetical protein
LRCSALLGHSLTQLIQRREVLENEVAIMELEMKKANLTSCKGDLLLQP